MRISITTLSCIFCLICILIYQPSFAQSTKKIEGYILEVGSSNPIAGANIQIVGTNYQTISDLRGYFAFENIPAGSYSLKLISLGYKQKVLPEITITPAQTLKLIVHLNPEPIPMPEIEVIEKKDNQSVIP